MEIFRILVLLLVASVIGQEWDTVQVGGNYANGKAPLPVWQDYTVYKGVNFSQLEPHTVLGGDKHVDFVACNVKNCDEGPNARFIGCYQEGNHVDYCYWHFKDTWPLDAEPDSCEHTDSITVMVDSSATPIDTVSIEYHRSEWRAVE